MKRTLDDVKNHMSRLVAAAVVAALPLLQKVVAPWCQCLEPNDIVMTCGPIYAS